MTPPGARGRVEPTQSDYQRLLAVRTALRKFLTWSESAARAEGLTPAQHQLLLTVKGHPNPAGPTLREVADYLCTRHQSVVELVDRAEAAGLVLRRPDLLDARVVRVVLTTDGDTRIRSLSPAALRELAELAPLLNDLAGLTQPGEGR